MTRRNETGRPGGVPDGDGRVLRPHAEQAYAHELDALARADDHPRPPQWRMSPWAVVTYLLGGVLPDGTTVPDTGNTTTTVDGESSTTTEG